MSRKMVFTLAFLTTIFMAACFRFFNLNWDQDQHLHPDERFLTMVSTDLKWPDTFSTYLNTNLSPLNPHNTNYGFYVYGTFPVFATKAVATLMGWDDYGRLILVGRFLSVILEIGICLLVYLITKNLTRRRGPSLLALFFYACLITPIQLAHFYATDTWYVFFIVLSFYLTLLLLKPPTTKSSAFRSPLLTLMLGISIGLIGASKINSFLFLSIIGLAFLIALIQNLVHTKKLTAGAGIIVMQGLLALIVGAATLRLAQPYLFTGPDFFDLGINPKVIANWKELSYWSKPEHTPPYGLQWIPTVAYLYPMTQLIFWGLGVPGTLLILGAFITVIIRITRRVSTKHTPLPAYLTHPYFWLAIFWVIMVFAYQGGQFAKALRYFYPLMPFLAILTGSVLGSLVNRSSKLIRLAGLIILFFIFWNALAFMQVYRAPHTRNQASTWIYRNIPPGSVITTEVWDDGLPNSLGPLNSSLYTPLALPLYDDDTPEKWTKLTKDLNRADYVFMTSNRLWRTIASLPEKYPIASKYYELMLNGQLGFETVATFTAYPCLTPPLNPIRYWLKPSLPETTNLRPPAISLTTTPYCAIAMNDDGADETFTVYDHPKVIILRNVDRLDPATIYAKLH